MPIDEALETERLVSRTIEALKHANALRATQGWLTGRELRSGVSWDLIGQNLTQYLHDDDLAPSDLHDFVTDIHSRAHKLVSLYSVSKKNHALLWNMAVQTLQTVDNDLEFPYVVDAQQLESLTEKPRHIYTRPTNEGVEMFFTSARLGSRTDDILIEDIDADVRDKYRGASRMYVDYVERRQAFDVIFIPTYEATATSRLMQVRVDTGGIAAANRELVRTYLEQSVLETSGIGGTKFQPLNIFKAVRAIYDDDDEGRVTGLHFNYAAGSLTHKIKRTADGQRDLRRDPFHNGGATKVNKKNMLLYWLSVELEDDSLRDPESVVVTLPGAVRHLNGHPLHVFELSTFASETTIAYAVGVIFRHVDNAP